MLFRIILLTTFSLIISNCDIDSSAYMDKINKTLSETGKLGLENLDERNRAINMVNSGIYIMRHDREIVAGQTFEIYNKNYWSRAENNSLARIASQKLRDFFKFSTIKLKYNMI